MEAIYARILALDPALQELYDALVVEGDMSSIEFWNQHRQVVEKEVAFVYIY